MKRLVLLISLTVLIAACHKQHEEDHTLQTLVLQPGPEEAAAASVRELPALTTERNAGMVEEGILAIGTLRETGGVRSYRSFLRFGGLDAIPAQAVIRRATLYLYGAPHSEDFSKGNRRETEGAGNRAQIERITGGNWEPSTIDWKNMPASDPQGAVSIEASAQPWNYSVQVDVTELVQKQRSSGSNYGFALSLFNETPDNLLLFCSSATQDPSRRPKLVIEGNW